MFELRGDDGRARTPAAPHGRRNDLRTSETIKRVRLGEVCDVLDSMRKPITKQDRVAGPVPYYGATCVQDHVRDYIFDEPLVLLGEDGARWGADERSAYMISGKAWVNNHAHVLRPGAELDRAWLTYYLCHTDLNCYITGTTVRKLTQDKMRNIELPLPPLPVQRRIAAALDKISEMKRNAEARLQKLDLLVKARFNEMFGDGAYEEKELSAVTTFIDYRGKTPTKSESGVPLITAKNVRSFGFSIEPREYIPEEMYLGWMTRGFPAVGDVLFTTEDPLGNVCRIPNVYDKFAVGQRIVTMQPHRDILDATYLEFALRSGAFQRKVFEKSSGSTVTGIRSKLLEKLALPLPPLSLQRSFAAFVEKVEALKATAQASLARVDLLYRAKLQEYFG